MGKQDDAVIAALRKNGGYATFQQLNQLIDFSNWKTKTPFASVRRIVQENDSIFRIQPGLWALKEYESIVLSKFNIQGKDEEKLEVFTHSYYQGIITNIGNLKSYDTYIPAQDKNKKYLEQKLSDIATVKEIYAFTYPEIVRKARTVDVIWFNERRLPKAFFEVEHTTDIKNSLNKFFELQDFNANFYIIASQNRKKQFEDVLQSTIYNPIRNSVRFTSYESIVNQYSKMVEFYSIPNMI